MHPFTVSSKNAAPLRRPRMVLPVFLLGYLAALTPIACSRAPEKPSGPGAPPVTAVRAGYVGSATCAQCHPAQVRAFGESDHQRAMAVPTAQSVKGDFNGTTFDHLGVVSQFESESGKYFVTTQGPDGKPTRYEVAYVLGHAPLQQYLVHFPGGRLQCLPLAYDTRPQTEGGQRWFHVYGDEKIAPDDPLFWAGPMQNWNHMCASCHSTALEKGYDAKTDSFKTTWADPTLSCESCHGPAQGHLAWTQNQTADLARGFARSGVDRAHLWEMDGATGIAKRKGPKAPAAAMDACMRCHARGDVLDERIDPTAPLCDARATALLDPGLYRATGEIQDEVYEWGSFSQSRMHEAGVTCVDCHDPHSGKRLIPGNGLCAQCHLPSKFDVPAHSHHGAGSAGALCVNCHMPQHTYMGVDARRDHGFRVPRPDLTLAWGAEAAPNACATCHSTPKEDAAWAAEKIRQWTGGKPPRATFADALCAGRAGVPQAGKLLAELAKNGAQPAVARATALRLLPQNTAGEHGFARLLESVRLGLADGNPVVRAAAVALLQDVPPDTAANLGAPALRDEAKNVRLNAVRALLPCRNQLAPADAGALAQALDEAKATESLHGDRAAAQMNLGTLALLDRDLAEADNRFALALARDKSFAPAWVNRAEVARLRGDDAGGEKILREGLGAAYDKAPLHHALGLLLVRQKRLPEAVASFAEANRLRPQLPYHALLEALALDGLGKTEAGLTTLRAALKRHPHDRQLLGAMVELAGKAGHEEERAAAEKILAQWE